MKITLANHKLHVFHAILMAIASGSFPRKGERVEHTPPLKLRWPASLNLKKVEEPLKVYQEEVNKLRKEYYVLDDNGSVTLNGESPAYNEGKDEAGLTAAIEGLNTLTVELDLEKLPLSGFDGVPLEGLDMLAIEDMIDPAK